ncbi:hypothetical protein BKA65DRAFT_501792 [Rhexocercosporidium sp. MPI-PUGE-AT-0058]|nr:hypothetical protein BKA65DRAFT_501792 [Rhexocercosporidium sp. MPI-PUGE-AT-0058]
MKSQLAFLAVLVACFSECIAWDEDSSSSCAWPCVTNFPSPGCDESRSSSWESCFCSNETLIAEFKACVVSSSCADSEKIEAAELCSSTGAHASATYSAYLSSQHDEIDKWSTKGGSWSAYHSYWSTSRSHTWFDKGAWPTGTAGPWGSGSWPKDKCPGSDWPGWTSSGTWDKSDWDEEWTSWTSWTDCSTATSTTSAMSTTATNTVPATSAALPVSTSLPSATVLTAVTGSLVTSTPSPSASASIPPQEETSGSVGLSNGRLSSVRFMAMGATLFGIFFGMMIVL